MTTRRAASKAATNSTAASVASGDSRRSSLADATGHFDSFDNDSNRPTKRARLSDNSVTSSASRRSAGRQQKTPSQEPVESLEVAASKVHVSPPRILEPRAASTDSTSQEVTANGSLGNPDANVQQKLLIPFPKRRGRRPKGQVATPVRSTNGTPAPGTPFNNSQQDGGTDRDASRAPGKRMPGRRRAPNADPKIEAFLRRQLELRLAYRAVAKVTKPLLKELAQRTLNDLENDEEAHKASEEYEKVQAQLDAHLARRLGIIEKEKEHKTAQYRKEQAALGEVLHSQFVVSSFLVLIEIDH
jgi:cell fate (sporulation/competence/biofilm development) regulator YlbF (YheA/YmcA/DUF963 family)